MDRPLSKDTKPSSLHLSLSVTAGIRWLTNGTCRQASDGTTTGRGAISNHFWQLRLGKLLEKMINMTSRATDENIFQFHHYERRTPTQTHFI